MTVWVPGISCPLDVSVRRCSCAKFALHSASKKRILGKVFRGKIVSAFQRAFQNGQLNFHADLNLLANPKTFAAWLRPLFREKWIVYLKPPFGGPAYVLQYLGRYTHRVAISDHRLVSFADGQVTFRSATNKNCCPCPSMNS